MLTAIREMLNYDTAIYRRYASRDMEFTLYAAYWEAGKMHPRLVGMHTPDVCWGGAGWQMNEANYSWSLQRFGFNYWHAQYRHFTLAQESQYVLYWHVLNGRLSGYAEGPNSIRDNFLIGFFHDLQAGSGEQFFIRFSSNERWETLLSVPFVREVFRAFSPVLGKTAMTARFNEIRMSNVPKNGLP